MIGRPSLLGILAATAAVAALANAATVRSPQPPGGGPDDSRLQVAIDDDLNAASKNQAAARRALDLRERALHATEARVKASLQAARQPSTPDPAASPTDAAASASDQYSDLARIYQAMKPPAAAIVLEQLAPDVQMKVATRMKERSMAQIMGAMTPKGAATLSMMLARKQVPEQAPAPTPAPIPTRPGSPTAR